MKLRLFTAIALTILSSLATAKEIQEKPIVWIYSDISDRNLPGPNKHGTINDPDDISAMAAYLLLYNRFDTRGIVVTSTSRSQHKQSPDQALWAKTYFETAYRDDLPAMNEKVGGYPDVPIPFIQSAIKETGERFEPKSNYKNIDQYKSISPLIKLLEESNQTVNILCWGALTEPAILTKYCLSNGKADLLSKVRFISHWSNSSLRQGTPEHPEHVANCRDDAKACSYLKEMATKGNIRFYECGAIGQHGIVSGGYKGMKYFEQFNHSQLGKIFIEGSYVYNGVDFSDAATYIVLLGKWGVTLDDIAHDGSNPTEIERTNEKRLFDHSKELHDQLLLISNSSK